MVAEQNCGVIVQLCENQEEGREKCADYLPSEPTDFGNVTVSVKEPSHVTVANPSVRRTVLEASLPNGRNVEVVHLLYDGWPDRDVPLSPAAFRQLRGTVHKLAMARKCTVLIHCSAGIVCLPSSCDHRHGVGQRPADSSRQSERCRPIHQGVRGTGTEKAKGTQRIGAEASKETRMRRKCD
uniref:Tyrosine-protein phosphatase domain-containing protein n=1 Tax=Meloidogyne hapla TaxID=6305 RepID=A0A1I8C0X3_MELHA